MPGKKRKVKKPKTNPSDFLSAQEKRPFTLLNAELIFCIFAYLAPCLWAVEDVAKRIPVCQFLGMAHVCSAWRHIFRTKWFARNRILLSVYSRTLARIPDFVKNCVTKLHLLGVMMVPPKVIQGLPLLQELRMEGSLRDDWKAIPLLYLNIPCQPIEFVDDFCFPKVPSTLTCLALRERSEIWPTGCTLELKNYLYLTEIQIIEPWSFLPENISWPTCLRVLRLKHVPNSFVDHMPAATLVELELPTSFAMSLSFHETVLPNLKILKLYYDEFQFLPPGRFMDTEHMPKLSKLVLDSFDDLTWFPDDISPLLTEISILASRTIEQMTVNEMEEKRLDQVIGGGEYCHPCLNIPAPNLQKIYMEMEYLPYTFSLFGYVYPLVEELDVHFLIPEPEETPLPIPDWKVFLPNLKRVRNGYNWISIP